MIDSLVFKCKVVLINLKGWDYSIFSLDGDFETVTPMAALTVLCFESFNYFTAVGVHLHPQEPVIYSALRVGLLPAAILRIYISTNN